MPPLRDLNVDGNDVPSDVTPQRQMAERTRTTNGPGAQTASPRSPSQRGAGASILNGTGAALPGTGASRWSNEELRSVIDTAHEAFISMDVDGLITYWNPEAESTFGWSRDEVIGRVLADTIIPPQHREAHARGMRHFLSTGEGPVLNNRIEITGLHRDGHEFPVELTISAHENNGRHIFNAFLHDITERMRSTEELELVRELALAIGEADDVEEALRLSVRAICETAHLNAGQAWILNAESSRLVSTPTWFSDSAELDPFRSASLEVTFEPGYAFIGRAWATSRPVWVDDLGSDPECMRADVAREVGLGAAFAVPVLADDTVVAVMEFLQRDQRISDKRLIELLCAVTAQLGSLIRRKRTEDELRKRELQLAHAQQVARVGSWEWDVDADRISWSDELYRIFGLDQHSFEATFDAFLRLVHPDDRDRVAAEISSALDDRAPFERELRIIRSDGATRTLRCHGEVLTDTPSHTAKMVGTCQDVTERRRAEEQIALARELALSIGEAETVEQAIAVSLRTICERTGWDLGQAWIPAATGSYLECSAAWFTTSQEVGAFRRRSESMTIEVGVGLPGNVYARKAPVWLPDVRSEQNFPRAPWAREVGLGAGLGVPVLADDEVVAVLEFFVLEPCPEDEQLVGVVSGAAAQLGNLVRRKQAEEALRKSEEGFRLLVENAKDYAIVMLDRNGHVESWNQGAERIIGYSAEDMLGYHVSRLYSPSAVEQAEPERHLELATRNGRYEESDWRLRKDGLRFWANIVITPLYEGDELRGFSYVTQDVSERKQANDELRRLSAIVEHSEDAIVSTTSDRGIITSWNPGAERLFGYSAREAIGRSITILIPPESTDEAQACPGAVCEEGRAEHREIEALRKNGGTVEVSPHRVAHQGRQRGAGRHLADRPRRHRSASAPSAISSRRSARIWIARSPITSSVKGRRMRAKEADVTMMFVDIRDFTAFAEQYEPREVLSRPSIACSSSRSRSSPSRGGHVDKFVGDGLLAIFGAPEHLPDHADRALEAALEIGDACPRAVPGRPRDRHRDRLRHRDRRKRRWRRAPRLHRDRRCRQHGIASRGGDQGHRRRHPDQ